MASECFDVPIKVEKSVIDVIDVEEEIIYQKVVAIVWVDVGKDELVPHRYGAWYSSFDGSWFGPLHGFNRP